MQMKNIYFILLISLVSYSQDLNYEYTATFGNHVIAIEEINYEFTEGDIIGCFFVNSDGNFQCCGSTVYTQGTAFVSAWPDDLVTDYNEGFLDGDNMILAFRLCDGIDYIDSSQLIYNSVVYQTNGISTLSVTLSPPPDCSGLYLDASFNQSKEILKITDLKGCLIEGDAKNQFLIILYDDGTVEKKFINR